MALPPLTLGIEEEFQIVDPQTRQLRSHISQMFKEGQELLPDQLQEELHLSVLEIGSRVLQDIADARAEVTRTRTVLSTPISTSTRSPLNRGRMMPARVSTSISLFCVKP